MAIFNLASVGDLSNAEDLKQVKDYLFKLQEQLRYMFANLDPDDNYASSVPKLVVAKDYENQAKIEVDVNGITMEVGGISSDEVLPTLNTKLQVAGNKLTLTTGHVVIQSSNFTLNEDGSAVFSGALSAASGTFTGAMTAGSININNNFTVNSSGQVTANDITINNGTTTAKGTAFFQTLLAMSSSFQSTVVNSGGSLQLYGNAYLYGSDIYPSGSWWAGWGIAATVQAYHD